MPESETQVEVDGRFVRVTKPHRVLWPGPGFTKAWMIDYYRAVAAVLLPHLADRPLTLHRFPEGVLETHWYQTRAPSHPSWVRTVTFRPERSGKVFDVVVLDDVAGLVWAAQIGAVELHPFLGTSAALDIPRIAVFDLDPGHGAVTADVARVALSLRELLAAIGLRSFPKSSGQKGLHVVVPLNGSQPYNVVKPFARTVARLLTQAHPELVTDNMNKDVRTNRVLVDWSQNDPGKSTVAPYSLRGSAVPTAAVPLTWEEVEKATQPDGPGALLVRANDVLRRIDAVGDLHAEVATLHQVVPSP